MNARHEGAHSPIYGALLRTPYRVLAAKVIVRITTPYCINVCFLLVLGVKYVRAVSQTYGVDCYYSVRNRGGLISACNGRQLSLLTSIGGADPSGDFVAIAGLAKSTTAVCAALATSWRAASIFLEWPVKRGQLLAAAQINQYEPSHHGCFVARLN